MRGLWTCRPAHSIREARAADVLKCRGVHMLADDAELAAGTATAVIAAAIAPADRNSVTLMRLDGRVILHPRVLFAAVKRL